MSPSELIRDPVLQLNLLIWMTREQPPDHFRVRPLFHEAGFELRNIDSPFTLPEPVIASAKNKKISIGEKPSPDLIIHHLSLRKALYIEAKKSSFGPDSTNAKQGRAHLLAVGPACAMTYSPITDVLLGYHLPQEECGDMLECLSKLSHELTSAGLAPGAFGTAGFGTTEESVTYAADSTLAGFLNLESERLEILTGLDSENDPAPLLLLFVEDDHHDPSRVGLYRQTVVQQIHAALICLLHAKDELNIHVSAQELVVETTQGTVIFLPRHKRQRMEKLVVENIFKRIRDAWKDKHPEMIRLEGNTIVLNFETDPQRDDFLEWIEDVSKTKFSDKAASADHPDFPAMFSES